MKADLKDNDVNDLRVVVRALRAFPEEPATTERIAANIQKIIDKYDRRKERIEGRGWL